MDKNTLEKFKQQLKDSAIQIETELGSIADKDPNMEGDYDARFPNVGTIQSSDESAMEVTEYERRLPIEHILELRLQAIKSALKRIENGTYGICQVCGQPIDPKRLEVSPEVTTCTKCHLEK